MNSNKVILLVFYGGFCLDNFAKCSATNSTTKVSTLAEDDDYYLSYDYVDPISSNNGSMSSSAGDLLGAGDSLILPNPETVDSKSTVDALPNVELPDDSLADTDLRDHDFIDNLMYVYYGSRGSGKNDHGRIIRGAQVVMVGLILSCVAQFLTIGWVTFRKSFAAVCGKRERRKELFLQMVGTFCLSNAMFMLEVYADRGSTKCLFTAILLHYLHLMSAFWIFMYCYHIHGNVSGKITNPRYFILVAYWAPFMFSLFSYVVSPNSFEIKRFCFISVQKGMIVNYMLPVSVLIVATTIYSLNGIRKINIQLSKLEYNNSAESLTIMRSELEMLSNSKNSSDKQEECQNDEVVALRETKTCLKLLCVIETGYNIVWFMAVLALENNDESNDMAVVHSASACLLNWFIFFKSKSFIPSNICPRLSLKNCLMMFPVQEEYSNSTRTRGSSDNIPLLLNSENATELKELKLDYISTISS